MIMAWRQSSKVVRTPRNSFSRLDCQTLGLMRSRLQPRTPHLLQHADKDAFYLLGAVNMRVIRPITSGLCM